MSTEMTRLNSDIDSFGREHDCTPLIEEYSLDAYKGVVDGCLQSNHTITTGNSLYECLNHNYS